MCLALVAVPADGSINKITASPPPPWGTSPGRSHGNVALLDSALYYGIWPRFVKLRSLQLLAPKMSLAASQHMQGVGVQNEHEQCQNAAGQRQPPGVPASPRSSSGTGSTLDEAIRLSVNALGSFSASLSPA